jgi:AraC-like DNA-binding protein
MVEKRGDDKPSAWLFEPGPSLRGLVFGAIGRDTRRRQLEAHERFGCMPAFPFCALTFVFEGAIHMVDEGGQIAERPTPALSFAGPHRKPVMSWCPGPVHALTVAFYPDAWREVTGRDAAKFANTTVAAEAALDPDAAMTLAGLLVDEGEAQQKWEGAERLMAQLWEPRIATGGTPFVRDWTRGLIARAALSGGGRSARQMQRRLKSWTGLNRRELQAHARIEQLFERTHESPDRNDLAAIAAEAGYADQSHMGREVKRLTGVSPARINALIRTDERYWVYRLMGERF